ncbi:MAG TPA: long-chain fatty acid--CoA ligase [Bacteroidales bacterium]|nr:long-chain fatty acid--CoA ligase [Bacteroidales bacterium]
MVKENFIRLFEDSFRQNWELPAFSDYGTNKTLTYGEAAAEVEKLHLLFEACGVKDGDKVALIGKNSTNWAVTYIATVTYGAVIVPILQDFKPNDIIHIVNHSESVLLFSDENIWDNLDLDQIPNVRAVFSLKDYSALALKETVMETEDGKTLTVPVLKAENVSRKHIDRLFNKKYVDGFHQYCIRYVDKSNSEIVSLNYTSGTTGFSKGVMTSGNALANNVRFGIETKIIYRGSKQVCFLPLAHSYGCAFDFLTSVCVGGHTWFVGRTPSPKILLGAFAEVKPTAIFSVPLIIEKIYKKQIQPMLDKKPISWVLKVPYLDDVVLGQIRQKLVNAFGGEFWHIILGGAPLNAEVEEFFHRLKFPLVVGYGMTECAPLIAYEYPDKFKMGSCGKAITGMEIKIEDPDENGVGEILTRGEGLMSGYYKNEAATKEVFTEDGWLRTGDRGMLDEEGNLYIKGRSKTMLLGSSGQNIYPEELEAKLNNMPYVMESIVLQDGDKLVALVCPDFEMADANHLDHDALVAAMEENRKELNKLVPAYESVSRIRLFGHEFEKTPKKSIKRFLYTASMGE